MPNWCNNRIEITADKATIDLIISQKEAGILNALIPMPVELRDATCPNTTNPEVMKAKYGHEDWYSWAVANWGIKWDITIEDDADITRKSDTEVVFNCDSPWSPPVTAFHKMKEMGMTVKAYYYECGMQFAGIWDDGEDDEYSNISSVEEAENLPTILNDIFNIAETIANYEE